jgi:hypothetical protein
MSREPKCTGPGWLSLARVHRVQEERLKTVVGVVPQADLVAT